VFLCSPNNPTGNRLDSQAILELARALEGRALVVVDEAYVEFADGTVAHSGIATGRAWWCCARCPRPMAWPVRAAAC
jgi:histidinol-phosphate/aromatic aminotransferase/cobyric acid decarboxylase-like protein